MKNKLFLLSSAAVILSLVFLFGRTAANQNSCKCVSQANEIVKIKLKNRIPETFTARLYLSQ